MWEEIRSWQSSMSLMTIMGAFRKYADSSIQSVKETSMRSYERNEVLSNCKCPLIRPQFLQM